MSDWWISLSVELKVFYTIGIVSFLITTIQTTLTLVGIGAESIDFDIDLSDGDHSTGIGLFSTQTISAFFLGFGWGGVLMLKLGLNVFLATLIAFNIGGALMAGMYFMLVGLMSLQGKGNLNYASALGSTAEVYVTIPSSRTGEGQIQVMISGRLSVADAETEEETALGPGRKVRIVGMIGDTGYLVESY